MTTQIIKAQEEAARRCDEYLVRYGVEASWTLHPLGLKLHMNYGAEKVERLVSWCDLAALKDPGHGMSKIEAVALSGLGS